MYKCPNCNYRFDKVQAKLFRDITDLWERVSPGDEVPVGECPECQALFHESDVEPALRERIREAAGDEALLCDGFDEAVLGIGERCGQPTLVVYDAEKMADILVKRDGMTQEEAVEYLDFNVFGAWMGKHTPIFVHKINTD